MNCKSATRRPMISVPLSVPEEKGEVGGFGTLWPHSAVVRSLGLRFPGAGTEGRRPKDYLSKKECQCECGEECGSSGRRPLGGVKNAKRMRRRPLGGVKNAKRMRRHSFCVHSMRRHSFCILFGSGQRANILFCILRRILFAYF